VFFFYEDSVFPPDPYLFNDHQSVDNGTIRGRIPAECITSPKANETRIAEVLTSHLICAFTVRVIKSRNWTV